MRSVSPIPNDVLLEKFDSLSGEIRITPEQLSLILGISVYSLQEKRRHGNLLPHVREGAKVLYRIKDVRKYLKEQPLYENYLAYYQARKDAIWDVPQKSDSDR
ncbi:MAG: helix-turn-helix domain-containing protein [Nitrosomonadales bacterium]|nr:helix-turn-helix domain-containing protein [Nitrosomonadales bacterium]